MKNTVPPFTIFHKQSIVILLFFLSISSVFGQVKIGDNPQNIDPSSLLELESTDKAIILSRISTAQMQAITPLQGAVIYNIEEQCVFYYNGSNWINLCRDANGFSIIDNGDNTYTVNDGVNPEFTFSTNTETITNITQNADGTYTYTNEAGEETLIATSTTGTSTFSITDNGNNTYTFNDGTIPAFTLSANPETVTTIVQNPNGTFTYTNEADEETVIANGSGTGTSSLSITDNGDNTYTVNDGTNPEFTITATPETVTSIVQNPNGTFTYTNEAGEPTVIANGSGTGTSSLSITDNGDNTFTVNDGINPEFTITAKPETVTSLEENPNGTYTYTNEADEVTIIASSAVSIADNGDNTYTVNDGTNPEFTITTKPETVTSLEENPNGTYTYTNEADDDVVISFSGNSEQGSVFFADNANGFAESNGQFFWENSTARLGLGTNTNLTDRLTINGNIGISGGDETNPPYRFSGDPDTGIFNAASNELGFTVGGTSNMKLTQRGLYLNNAEPLVSGFGDMPLLIKENQGEFLGLQLENGDLKWILNLFAQTASIRGGLAFVETGNNGNGTRFFIENARNLAGPDYGRIGINTRTPAETLHVVGTLRVDNLPSSQAGYNIVTVDAAGKFHRSTAQSSKSTVNSVANFMGRWMNSSANVSLTNGQAILPIFGVEDFKDGGANFYEVNANELNIKRSGRYEIRATIALRGNVTSDGKPANTYARITVNNRERGAISVAGSNGTRDSNVLSSIHISDILKLKTGDTVTITLYSDINSSTINFAGSETSNFTIIKQ